MGFYAFFLEIFHAILIFFFFAIGILISIGKLFKKIIMKILGKS